MEKQPYEWRCSIFLLKTMGDFPGVAMLVFLVEYHFFKWDTRANPLGLGSLCTVI